jgi:putative aldouronate transport system permease protein
MSVKKPLLKRIFYYRWIYLLLLPGLIQIAIFAYGPLYGIQIAFRSFNFFDGIWGSPWVGLDNFRFMFNNPFFFTAVRNTVTISLMHLTFGFPAPIILAIFINELRSTKLKRSLQTIFTFPHFLSWIVISGMVFRIFAFDGLLNSFIQTLFSTEWRNIVFLDGGQYRWFLVFSGIWQGAGWSSIIYLAAIAGIDQEQYESATIDGANRWHKIWYITWPGMKMTALLLLILAIGGIMGGNFDQIFNTYNPSVFSHGDIISTFVTRTLRGTLPNHGFLTSVGVFNGLINAALLLGANYFVKRIQGTALFALGG